MKVISRGLDYILEFVGHRQWRSLEAGGGLEKTTNVEPIERMVRAYGSNLELGKLIWNVSLEPNGS